VSLKKKLVAKVAVEECAEVKETKDIETHKYF
jgi:hypothetical protein